MEKPPVVMKGQPAYTEKQLWEKYLALTYELLKFIKAEEIDLFLQLVDQRQELLDRMKAVPEAQRDFSSTPECMAMREQIKPMDMQIMYKARTWLNKSRRNNAQVRNYDVTGYGSSAGLFSREY